MKLRRSPWLSGLIMALALTIWLVGQVIGGVFAMAADMLAPFPSGPNAGSTSSMPAP